MTPVAKCATLSLGLTLMATLMAPPAWAGDTSIPTEVGQVAQGNLVTGTVVDEQGEPLLGATVRVEGTKTATTTDVNGRFSIKANPGQTILVTYVGMKPFTAKAGSGPINAVMTSDNALDEVVVVGYGTVRKADLAGSVSVLEGKAFEAQPITTVQEALQGRVSGVNIVSDGLPGGSTKIRIRGANSINKSNDPLYVVDGLVRESGLDGINPEDIASMQILKDASSTAIYGSRGANGVVIITTKRGRAGESKLTVDMSLGWSNATHLPEVLGTREYAKALVDFDGIPEAEVKNYLDGSDPGTNWKDEVFKTGVVQNYKVVFTKGSEDTQLYVSGNYMSHKGIMKDTQYERYAARLNVNSNIFSWLNINADVNLSHGEGKGIGGIDMGGYNPVYLAFNYSPTMHVKNELGEYLKDPYCSINESPLASLTGANQRRADVLNGHFDLRFNILPGLTFTSSNGIA